MPGIDVHGATPTEAVSLVALGLGPYAFALALIVMFRLASSTFNSIIRGGSMAHYRGWEMLITAGTAVVAAYGYTYELRPPPLPCCLSTWTG